jgi:VanZ family protein
MLKSLFKLSFNPFFSAGVILFLSLFPFSADTISNQLPKEGDNFRYKKEKMVYKFENGVKRPYLSSEDFFSHNNPGFGTKYENGGILVVTKSVLESIPTGEPVGRGLGSTETQIEYEPYRVLLSLDKMYHLLFYAWLSVACFFYFGSSYNKWGLAIILLGFGAVIEVLQELFFIERSASLMDVFFNSLGILLGMFFVFWVEPRVKSIQRIFSYVK